MHMQDQLTGGQSSLQQPRSDLQQNTANLQQSGSPTTSGNTSSVLSEVPPQGQLRVSTATSPIPSTVTPSTAHPAGNGAWFWLLLIPIALLVAALLPRRTAVDLPQEIIEEPLPTPVPQATTTKKTKKKSSKRKKSSRR